MSKHYHFKSGNSPLLISMPHVGTRIPKEIAAHMTQAALQMPDVDWHLPLLYDMAEKYDATVLSAEYMRYVIDLNRSTEDTSLYPGQDVTGLCPIDTFDKQPIYVAGKQPDELEIRSRIEQYWRPYHNKLTTELKRIHALHGIALLWDAHSIASQVPRFFDGKLPDLNFGTADTESCDESLESALKNMMLNYQNGIEKKLGSAEKFSYVFNGRFKGGYITRHYGVPTLNIHALQMEMNQCIYMQDSPHYNYQESLAQAVKPLLSDLLATCLAWAHNFKTTVNKDQSLPSRPI
jgi:N-formylglutamate deformylase